MAREPFTRVWAEAPDQFEEPNNSTWEKGWEGGSDKNPPQAKWENWWHNRADVALRDIESKGAMTWHPEAIYSKGAFAIASDGVRYRSALDANQGNDPAIDSGSNWVVSPYLSFATDAEESAWEERGKASTPGGIAEAFLQNSSLLPNGGQKLPGGLALKWGISSSSSAELNITFSESFVNSCFLLVPASIIETQNDYHFAQTTSFNSSGGSIALYQGVVGSPPQANSAQIDVVWFAIGY